MIKSYSFGKMVIDNCQYKKDLIILSDKSVVHPWRRNAGHRLVMADLEPFIDIFPAIFVVGTGKFGMMKPDPNFCSDLESEGIQLVIFPTKKAVDQYNNLLGQNKDVAACFHLTC